uniref:Protein phosphatase 2C like domain containing 1 n=1 Tax=Chrysemys picta bellii TaxID=8478 RepID=A0A8C3IE28_CHRPI|nr:protein phosphatase 2C-like domain-containing protein 1 isoform X1 [Chrysemys picta bellii]XP_008168812.1 protein phosphatase 2C-like domain-containing protein 1 isoform X1 [Chrysemys picta bellii]
MGDYDLRDTSSFPSPPPPICARLQRMTWEPNLQSTSKTADFELYRHEENQAEKVGFVPRKVDSGDIPVLCSICQQTIYPHQLFYHKKEHKALALLGYHRPWIETDTNKLLLQRQQLISRLIKFSKYTERDKQKIDCSLELLKNKSKGTSYFSVDNIVDSSGYLKKVSNSLIKALAICQDKNSTWRADMEDTFIVLDNYGNRSDTCFLGLFDGYHGVFAAETVSAEFPLLFLDQLSQTDSSYKVSGNEEQILDSFVTVIKENYKDQEKVFSGKTDSDKKTKPNTYEWIHKAYAKSFWRMDRLLRLGRNEVSKVRWSSCTAVTCLVERISNEKEKSIKEQEKTMLLENTTTNSANPSESSTGILHIANIGNIHAVLCKNGKSYCLTKEHSTSNSKERDRILQNGGNISTNEPKGLVEGLIRATRGLGHHGDPKLKKSVIPVPHTISVPTDDSCQFLILASNGLWEVLDKNEVVILTLRMFTSYLEMYAQREEISMHKYQYSVVPYEDYLCSSMDINDLEDRIQLWYFNKEAFLQNQHEGSLIQNNKKSCSCNRRDSQNENRMQPGSNKESSEEVQQLDDHVKQADTKACLSNNHGTCSQHPEIIQSASGSQEGSKELKQFDDDTKAYLSNNRGSHSQIASKGEINSATFYDSAANYISKQLVKTALAAGSRDNITILVALLNGCDKIPNYIQNV